jgi:hypothetical protein
MPGGRYRFEFVGKEHLAFRVTASLLFVNTILMLTLNFGDKYFLPKQTPIVSWYSDHSIVIQFILLASLTSIFVIFRKRVRYVGPK